jgi:peroxiredoxin
MNPRNTIYILLLILAATLLSRCDSRSPAAGKALIIADYEPYEELVFLSRVTAARVDIIDSADISHGSSISFRVKAPDQLVYRLAHKELYPLMVIAENGDTVRIRQTDDPAWPYHVEGSDECMLLVEYLERLNRDHYKVDSLAAVFHASQGHPEFLAIRDHVNDEFTRLHEAHRAYAREFISRHPSSLASIIVINSFFKEFALFNQEDDFSDYEMLDRSLMARLPENQYVLDFHNQVENIRAANEYELEARMRLSPGRLVPDFKLPTGDGREVGPKDFEGKSLLIYFWAAVDAPSRQASPTIRKAEEAFGRYGLEMLSISFDKDVSVWQAAIDLDSIPGTHVTDLKGAGSPVQKLFNLKMKLPAYLLVDTKGRIVTLSHDFDKLREVLVDYFSSGPEY